MPGIFAEEGKKVPKVKEKSLRTFSYSGIFALGKAMDMLASLLLYEDYIKPCSLYFLPVSRAVLKRYHKHSIMSGKKKHSINIYHHKQLIHLTNLDILSSMGHLP